MTAPQTNKRRRNALLKAVTPPRSSSFVTPSVSRSLSHGRCRYHLVFLFRVRICFSLSLTLSLSVYVFVKLPAFHHEFEQVDVATPPQLFQEEQKGHES